METKFNRVMTKEEILNKVGFDLDKAKAVYEWLNDDKKEDACTNQADSAITPVSIHYDINGKPDGVRVCVADEDFIIELHDAFDGEGVEWNEIENSGKNTFSFRQACIVCAYYKEINEALVEAGGDPFQDHWYWTNETVECYAYAARYFYGPGGSLLGSYKACSFRVRFLASVSIGL